MLPLKIILYGNEGECWQKVRVALGLRWPDAAITTSTSADEFLGLIAKDSYDLAVVSTNGTDTLEDVIRRARSVSDLPLTVMESSAQAESADEAAILQVGADDFVSDSAGPIEVLARVVALLRRARRLDLVNIDHPLSAGALTLHPSTHEAFLGEERLHLTATEFRVLHYLLSQHGNVASHRAMSAALWGDEVDSSRLAKKYVQRLRKKLEASYSTVPDSPQIISVYGVGYRLTTTANERVLAPR